MEETLWRQKSGEIWLREEDNNITFFHKMTNVCSRRNLLTIVRVNGDSLFEEGELKDGVCRAFHSLLYKTEDCRLSTRGFVF